MDFIQRPALWLDAIKTHRATASAAPNFAFDYCLRAGRLSKESLEDCDLSSLEVLMVAAEPVKPDTYTRFLETFQPYGLRSESFYAAYGLAENTLAVSLGGRSIVSVNRRALTLGKARMTTEVSEIDASTQIVSCGTPLPGSTSRSWIRSGTSLSRMAWLAKYGSRKRQMPGLLAEPGDDVKTVPRQARRRQPL